MQDTDGGAVHAVHTRVGVHVDAFLGFHFVVVSIQPEGSIGNGTRGARRRVGAPSTEARVLVLAQNGLEKWSDSWWRERGSGDGLNGDEKGVPANLTGVPNSAGTARFTEVGEDLRDEGVELGDIDRGHEGARVRIPPFLLRHGICTVGGGDAGVRVLDDLSSVD